MKILKDSIVYIFGEIVSKAIPFLLIPYLSRKLGSDGYGELSYYQAYISLFIIFLGLSQEGAVARYFYFYGRNSLGTVVWAGYAYTIAVGIMSLVFCYIFNSEILMYVVLCCVFQILVSVQLSLKQCQRRAKQYVSIQLFSAIVSVLLTVIMLEYYETDLVEKRILAILFSNVIVFAFSYLSYRRNLNIVSFSFRRYKLAFLYILSIGVPLILHQASFFIKGQMDRIFIYHKFSERDLGIYTMGASIAMILSVVIQAINIATVPYYYQALKQKKISIKQVYRWTLCSFMFSPVSALLVSMIPESFILDILGKGQEFLGVKYYIFMFSISISLVVPYLLLVNYLFYYGKNSLISICSIFSSVVYVILLFTFTKIEYVPYASIFSAISIIPLLFLMTKKTQKEK